MTPFTSDAVKQVFDACPAAARRRLMALRELIFATAAKTTGVGPIDETLKWGEPAYLTRESKSGSTVRLQWKATDPRCIRLLFHCQTDLVGSFRRRYPGQFTFEGNRALVFQLDEPLPKTLLADCVSTALTYHRSKRPVGLA